MNQELITQIITDYAVNGTNVENSITAGAFSTPPKFNSGVNVGNAFPYTFLNTYNEATSSLINITIPSNFTQYIQLGEISNDAVKQVLINGERCVELITPSSLKIISSVQDTSIIFISSGIDQWSQKTVNYFNFSDSLEKHIRPIKFLNSIYISNSTDVEVTIQIKTSPYFELPYFNITGAAILLANSSIGIYNVDSVNEKIKYNFTLHSNTEFPDDVITAETSINNSVRPIIQIDDSNYINNYITVLQNVMGFGSLPDFYDHERQTFINNIRSVIGPKQYSKDWIGWQG